MGTFKSSKILYASPNLIPEIAKAIEAEFIDEGFEVKSHSLISGGYDISLAKGNMFKAILGLKSALKISIEPREGNIFIEAGVGIFGQQAVPTVISMFFLWPVLITQIWGMITQSKLDEKVIKIAEDYIIKFQQMEENRQSPSKKFCTLCGTQQSLNSNFCSNCGYKFEP